MWNPSESGQLCVCFFSGLGFIPLLEASPGGWSIGSTSMLLCHPASSRLANPACSCLEPNPRWDECNYPFSVPRRSQRRRYRSSYWKRTGTNVGWCSIGAHRLRTHVLAPSSFDVFFRGKHMVNGIIKHPLGGTGGQFYFSTSSLGSTLDVATSLLLAAAHG